MKVEAGLMDSFNNRDEDVITKRFKNLFHINSRELMEEALEILQYNYLHIDFIDKQVDLGFECPLDLHCSYSVGQIMAAFGYFEESKKPSFREGVKYFRENKLDVFFVTLNKS